MKQDIRKVMERERGRNMNVVGNRVLLVTILIFSLAWLVQPALAADYDRDLVVLHIYHTEDDDLCGPDETKICDDGCYCCEDANGQVVWCRTCWCDIDLEPIPLPKKYLPLHR